MIHAYYRLSDKNRRGKAPPYFTNEICLLNFLKNFNLYDGDTFTLIADNISDSTENWIKTLNKNYIKTSLGNSGSFDFILKKSIQDHDDDDIIYFIENDYIHRKYSREALIEAFDILNADYVSLYDAPEKYNNHYNINYNKFIDCGSNIFNDYKSIVYYGSNNYWRSSNSFTMTFAAKVKTLKKDYETFKYNITEPHNGEYKPIPNDYALFNFLSTTFQRKLITPIPGYCTHGDILSPNIVWQTQI